MKRYTLLIDTSASSLENELYIFEADTIKAAKAKLTELNLSFAPGYIYCATIGRKEIGRKNNRFWTIARTDSGRDWKKTDERLDSGVPYIPEGWRRVSNWLGIGYFQLKPVQNSH